jgi:hypothetical protein
MGTKLIAMILLLLLVGAPYTQIAYAGTVADHGDEDGNNDDINDTIYENIKAAAEARRDELLYLLGLELPPGIIENLEEALYAMEIAEEMGDPREATEQYLYALKMFRNTWQKYLIYNPEAAEESFEELDEKDKPSPEETEPPEGLEEEINVAKEKRLIKIQEQVQKKIAMIGEHVDELKDYLSEKDSKTLEKALDNEEKKLENIMDKVSRGDYDDAIDELIVTNFEIEDDVDEMDDKEAAKTLKMVEKLQSQVQKTEEKKQRKADDGEDTSEEDDTIETCKKELDKVKQEFKDKAENSRKPDTDKKQKDRDKGGRSNGNNGNNGNNGSKGNNGKNG